MKVTVVEDTGRQEFLAGVSDDALYIADMMRSYKKVCDAADKTAELAEKTAKLRDDFFTEKLRCPAFRDAVDRVRDWAAAKRDGDFLTVNGKKYTSVKAIFEKEWGVSYEHVRKCCLKLDRLRGLVDGECETPTQPAIFLTVPQPLRGLQPFWAAFLFSNRGRDARHASNGTPLR